MTDQSPRYDLALFSGQSWQKFRAHGGTVYATTKTKQTRAQKIEPGDLLICYVSKRQVFAGVLRVTGPAWYDETPLYGQDVFPIRLDVKVVIAVDPDGGVSVSELRDQLVIFSRLRNPKSWVGFFLNSFNQFPEKDGKIITAELEKLRPRRDRERITSLGHL